MPHFPNRRTILAGLAALPALPNLASAQTERSLRQRVALSGHSLTDAVEWPLKAMVQAVGGPPDGESIDRSTTPGSTMKYRWQPDSPMDIDAKLGMAKYDTLVLTERVPVRSAIMWEETEKYALLWFEHAWKNGNGGRGAETILYASWIGVSSGPGNEDPNDMPDERQIPWPLIFAAIYDAMVAGTAPGITALSDLFEDDIHPNRKGAYPIALAHFAVIYGRDPRSIPIMRGEEGWPSREQQEWMQTVVWDVLSAFPDSGLT
jgi:hypothetical protein